MILAFFKTDLGKLLVILALAAVAIGLVHLNAFNEGAAKWKAKHEQYVAREEFARKFQADAWAKALAAAKTEQAQIAKELGDQLKEAQEKQQPIKVVIKEVTKYVTPQADANCSVTDGFVWMYNSSLQLPTDSQLAASRPRDADAPSGIALSTVGAVAGENNAECVLRGEVIDAWQNWYLRNKAVFDRMAVPAP